MKKISILVLLFLTTAFVQARGVDPQLLPDVAVMNKGQHVVINIPQLRLFLFRNGQLDQVFPVAVGKYSTQTPLGEYTIRYKSFKPDWHVPLSIQKEMKRQNRPVVKVVKAGPDNPLGPVFVRFGAPSLGLGIHGTNAPWSVPSAASHGCVRLRSENALKFANMVESASPVSVVYQRYSLNEDNANHLWLSVYPNYYRIKDNQKHDYEALIKAVNQWSAEHQTPIKEKKLTTLLKGVHLRPICLNCKRPTKYNRAVMRPIAWTSASGEVRLPLVVLPSVPYTVLSGDVEVPILSPLAEPFWLPETQDKPETVQGTLEQALP